MSLRQEFSTSQLILRSLRPSGISLFLCVLIAVALVIINIILQSVDVGTALPGILDGQWSVAYTEKIVQPLTELLSSNTLNKGLIAALWGAAGFVVYVCFEYAVHWSRDLRESRTNIRMARGNVIEHPLVNSFWNMVFWRLGVLVVGIIFLIAVQPLLRNALSAATDVVFSKDLLQDGLRIALAVVQWAFVLHGLVVFLRLYTMRTRLFGDDKLY